MRSFPSFSPFKWWRGKARCLGPLFIGCGRSSSSLFCVRDHLAEQLQPQGRPAVFAPLPKLLCWPLYTFCSALWSSLYIIWALSRQNKRGASAQKRIFLLCEIQGVFFLMMGHSEKGQQGTESKYVFSKFHTGTRGTHAALPVDMHLLLLLEPKPQ